MVKQNSTRFLQIAIQWSSIALLYYDYLLTFRTEVKYIWKGNFQLSTALYIFCRYALPANVLYLLAISNKLPNCDVWYKVIGVISVLGRAAVLSVFAMRTYVVWGSNRIILYGLSSLVLLCIALDLVHVPGLRCQGSSNIQIANTLLSIFVVVFEVIATVLSTGRAIMALRHHKKMAGRYKGNIMYFLLQQGLLYFILAEIIHSMFVHSSTICRAVFGFTFSAIILNFEAPGGFFQRLLNAFTLPISGLISARFLLDLRRWYDDRVESSRRSGSVSRTAGASIGEFQVADHAGSETSSAGEVVFNEFGEDPLMRVKADGNLTAGLESSHELSVVRRGVNMPDDKGVGITSLAETSSSGGNVETIA